MKSVLRVGLLSCCLLTAGNASQGEWTEYIRGLENVFKQKQEEIAQLNTKEEVWKEQK